MIFSLAAPKIKTADQDLVVDVGQPLTMVVPYYMPTPKQKLSGLKKMNPSLQKQLIPQLNKLPSEF